MILVEMIKDETAVPMKHGVYIFKRLIDCVTKNLIARSLHPIPHLVALISECRLLSCHGDCFVFIT